MVHLLPTTVPMAQGRARLLNSILGWRAVLRPTSSNLVVAGCLLLQLISGCSAGRADARVSYWMQEAQLHVPVGTPIADAIAFFASRGLALTCCMSGPDIEQAYSAMERDVGRFAWTEYSALIVVDVSREQRVRRVRVLRVGMGL